MNEGTLRSQGLLIIVAMLLSLIEIALWIKYCLHSSFILSVQMIRALIKCRVHVELRIRETVSVLWLCTLLIVIVYIIMLIARVDFAVFMTAFSLHYKSLKFKLNLEIWL